MNNGTDVAGDLASRSAALKDVSVAQLQRLLDAKQQKLDALLARRARLVRSLEAVDRKIALLKGTVRGRKPGMGRGRAEANRHSLIHYVLEILRRNRKGLNLKDLGEQVLAAGYKTESAKFNLTLYQTIYNHRDKVAHDSASGHYRLVTKVTSGAE